MIVLLPKISRFSRCWLFLSFFSHVEKLVFPPTLSRSSHMITHCSHLGHFFAATLQDTVHALQLCSAGQTHHPFSSHGTKLLRVNHRLRSLQLSTIFCAGDGSPCLLFRIDMLLAPTPEPALGCASSHRSAKLPPQVLRPESNANGRHGVFDDHTSSRKARNRVASTRSALNRLTASKWFFFSRPPRRSRRSEGGERPGGCSPGQVPNV